jgi:carbamoyltransferase
MARIILGISAFYHDSAAAIVKDGEVIAAAQEERFSRKRHDPRFPRHAINYCLEEAFVEASDIDAIVFYDNPLLTWDRIVQNSMMAGPAGREQFEKAAQSVLGIKLWVNDYVKAAVGGLGKEGRVLFTEHHMSHAASCFYPSPFQKAAILTLDGVGEWATTTLGRGEGSKLELVKEIDYPHSLGLLYSAFTYFTGFKVNSGEYKLMGLAPYGEPVYAQQIRDKLIDIKPDGSYRLNTDYFGYIDGLVMTNDKFAALFGGPARKPESQITRREMNLAASVQSVLEEVVLKLCRTARKETGCENLTLAGGVALNCVANGKILQEGIFKDIWIQPAAGDAGGALGAALMVAHHYYGLPRKMNPTGRDTQKGSYLGPRYRPEEVAAFLDRKAIKYHKVADVQERANRLAECLDEGKVIGFMSGRMEFGPRALGSRSILGDPRRPDTQATMNLRIKYRESFRPFAPAVLPEMVSEYFELDCESPYMLLVAPVRKERRLPMDNEAFRRGDSDDMLRVINQPRSDLPAITHVDYSARIQTVHEDDHADFNRLLRAFKAKTGCGVVVNTSFNVRGEPIVCTPQDAYLCFMRTEIDVLVMEDCILLKAEQPKFEENEDWRTKYELD